MISRRQIRIKVMQAIYAWYCTGDDPSVTFDINLKDFADEIREFERRKGDKGDSRLLMELFYDTIKHHDDYDQLIQSKAENWELERIALIDRILMQMGISEMTHFEEIPIKVTINEYLEIAKKFSTPKSSKFINGILDSLYIQFKSSDQIQKSGRGLIEESLPKRRPMGFNRPNEGGGYNRPNEGGGYNRPNEGGGYNRPNDQQGSPRPQGNPGQFEDRRIQGGPKQVPPPAIQGAGTDAEGNSDDKKKRPRIRKNENDNS
jgi:transcription antitermination protein NusB